MCSKSVINIGNTLLMKLFSSTNTHGPFCKPIAALHFSFHIHKKGRLNLKFLRKSQSSKICVLKSQTVNAGEDVEGKEAFYIVGAVCCA